MPIFRSCRWPILMRTPHGGADEPFLQNDVDTVQEALNGTFSMLIQSFFDTDRNPQHAVCFERASDADCIAVFSSKRIFYLVQWKCSKKYFNAQQEALAAVNGFVEEMTAGQKVEKVFNHESRILKNF